uniref:Ubiquitin-like protease family profile domain-containing protein n=1 Tax=Brassica oleracea var. oleracea TaxID=109376 RepID=A0A0D3D7B4_BRAOL
MGLRRLAMSTKRKRAGKAIDDGTAPPEVVAVNERLPPRLFATDRYPNNRNNCYASLEFLLLVRDVLEGSAEMERLLCSSFGPLFKLPVRRCAFSAKLVHGMLSRQLFEPGYEVDDKTKPKKTDYVFWDKLFGGRCNLTLEDLAAMVVGDNTMPPGKKLRICLIIIVDGTMIPPKKVLGKCDDPKGVFYAQLRQESKFLLGFPLAVQLWAFEAIPVLLDRLGGDDSVTLLSYVGDKLPTHTGLVLTDVLYAEHNPKLTVLPMMEVDEDRDDGWGVFDCEIFDRKVAYMVDLLKSGHKFQKGEWGGGDASEPLYVHDPVVTEVKRKIRKLTHKEEAGALMKQRRLSRYFSRKGEGEGDKYEALLGVVEGIKKELGRLNKVVEKQGRMLRKYKGKTIGRFSSSKLGGVRKRKKSAVSVEPGALFGGSDPDGTDNSMEELGAGKRGETRTQTVAEYGLKEGDGVPLLYTKKGDETDEAHVVLYGSGRNTFYVIEEEVGSKTGGGGCCWQCLPGPLSYVEQESDVGADLGVPGEQAACGTEVNFGDLNRLVGVITRGVTVTVAEKEVGKGTEVGADTKDTDAHSEEASKVEKGKGVDGGKDVLDGSVKEDLVNVPTAEENVAAVDVKKAKGDGEKGALGDGLVAEKLVDNSPTAEQGAASEGEGCDSDGNGDMQVMELSDSSPCQRSEKHKPVERKVDLAALLLAKEPFTLEKLVPTVEDTDFRFFENVLVGNPKVLHLNAGKYDLDNQFFLDLAASQKWCVAKLILYMWVHHIEALVEYVTNRNEEILIERRSLFLPPWFVAHLQGYARAFSAAKGNRGRVLGDGRLSGFLTKEGRKWGAEVYSLYAPMIWDGNDWVGLCISLRDWRVLVLDPNPRLKDMVAVWGLLEAVSKMLPYLVEKVCPRPEEGAYSLEPFTVERMGCAYENRRSGDCGPVAVKFMELHALGNPQPRMDGLTDELVDIMRKQWAMDLYKD